MRKFIVLAILAVMVALGGLPSSPAEAGHRHYRGNDRTVVHYGYYPRYRHVFVRERYGYGDPYAYRYEPRGYYPYYNSGYWKPAHVLRARGRRHYVHPPYYAAWGYPDRHYHHRAWHAYHHGRIRHGHW
jgi:hypothetical protein